MQDMRGHDGKATHGPLVKVVDFGAEGRQIREQPLDRLLAGYAPRGQPRSRNAMAPTVARSAVVMGSSAVGASIAILPVGRARAAHFSISGKCRVASGRKRACRGRPRAVKPDESVSKAVVSSDRNVQPARAQAYASVLLPAADAPHNITPEPLRATNPACSIAMWRWHSIRYASDSTKYQRSHE
jgi:hypothetical protein